ncbi:hypothetical protein ACI1US_02158 [Leucobacter sp. BZR 635]
MNSRFRLTTYAPDEVFQIAALGQLLFQAACSQLQDGPDKTRAARGCFTTRYPQAAIYPAGVCPKNSRSQIVAASKARHIRSRVSGVAADAAAAT